MTRIAVDGEIQYEIEVRDKKYVTRRCLSDYAAASAISGRATRVWEAYDKDDPAKKSVALKDLWMDVESRSEGDTLEDIFGLMKEYKDKHVGLDDYRQYFLTTLAHGVVIFPDGTIDDTREAMRKQDLPDSHEFYRTSPASQLKAGSAPTGFQVEPRGIGSFVIDYRLCSKVRPLQHVKHYRIVFDEVGKPIHQLHTLKLAFGALHGAAQGKISNYQLLLCLNVVFARPALRWLCRINYVHRDISTGNILGFNGSGRLSDLKYCRRYIPPVIPTATQKLTVVGESKMVCDLSDGLRILLIHGFRELKPSWEAK